MTTENQIYTNNGFVILVDGTTFLIERVQYSHNGISDWEDPPFNPIEHANSITGLGTLPGHKYRRTMLAGSTTWGMAEYIVAQDGKNIEFSQNDEYITWRYVGDITWNNLILKDDIKGATGIQGVEGKGLCISALGAFDTKPITPTTVVTSGCCNGLTTTTTTGISTYLSLGNHRLNDIDDTGTYFSLDGNTWTAYVSATHAGTYCMYFGATSDTGTGAFTVKSVNIVQASSNGDDTKGYIFTYADGMWVKFINITVNDHMLQEASGSTHIGYMDSFTNAGTITGTSTIGIKSGKLEIIDDSVTAEKINVSSIGDGLIHTGTEIEVHVSDIVGTGIQDDGSNNLQVKCSDINDDGIGVNANKLYVKTENLISSSLNGGLVTEDTDDGGSTISKHLKINTGNSTIIENQKLEVKVNTSEGIDKDVNGVKLALASIKPKHLHSTVCDQNTIKQDVNGALYAVIPSSFVKTVNSKNGNLILNASNSTTANPSHSIWLSTVDSIGTITYNLNIDYNQLKLDLAVPDDLSGTFVTADTGSPLNTSSGIKSYIDTADNSKLSKDTIYGNIKIVSTGGNAGIQITPNNGTSWFKLNVDQNGNLFTTAI